jgi:hypothetical protein
MSFPIPRRPARNRDQQRMLPAPDPLPARPSPHAVVIFVVVIAVVVWLLADGYSVGSALAVVTGAGALAATITVWLTGLLPAAE